MILLLRNDLIFDWCSKSHPFSRVTTLEVSNAWPWLARWVAMRQTDKESNELTDEFNYVGTV